MSDIVKSDIDITELANDIELKLYNLYNQVCLYLVHYN